MDDIRVGIIGLGTRGTHALARNMAETYPEHRLRVTALHDRNPQRTREAADELVAQYAAVGAEVAPTLHEDGQALIADDEVDLVMVVSITDTHREYAVPALESGKRVYCDKPLAHTVEDAAAIVEAEQRTANPLIMGFTRRYEDPWRTAAQLLADGAIGRLQFLQVRDMIPYHRYLTGWWRRREWSGGALNDKGSHLFDVFNWMTGERPLRVAATGSRRALTEPEGHADRCHRCELVCPYRRRAFGTGAPVAEDVFTHAGPSWLAETDERYVDDTCVYAPGTDLWHGGSVQFTYPDGVVGSYLYTIFGQEADDEETLEMVGSEGRIVLTRATGEVRLIAEHGERREVLDRRGPHFTDSHFGADKALMADLRAFALGAPPPVSARDGLEATRMVVAAHRSMEAGGRSLEMEEILDV
jgi:predicted dehydrogenase